MVTKMTQYFVLREIHFKHYDPEQEDWGSSLPSLLEIMTFYINLEG